MAPSRKARPSRPKIPARITVEATPLQAQVAMMMDLAQPMQALRCSQPRVNTGAPRREAQRQSPEGKRGRRCSTSNGAAEFAYFPSSLGRGSRQTSKKRMLPAWDSSSSSSSSINEGSIKASRRRHERDRAWWGGLCRKASRSSITSLQPPSPVSLAPASTVSSGGTAQSFQPHFTAGRNPSPSRSKNAPEPPPGDPLPGVCYITYPATPDLASSCCPSLENLGGPISVDRQGSDADTIDSALQQSNGASWQDDGDGPVPDTRPAQTMSLGRQISDNSGSNMAGNLEVGIRRPGAEGDNQDRQGHLHEESHSPLVSPLPSERSSSFSPLFPSKTTGTLVQQPHLDADHDYGIESPSDWPGLAFEGGSFSSSEDHRRGATEPLEGRFSNENGLPLPSGIAAKRQTESTGTIGRQAKRDKRRIGKDQVGVMKRCRATGRHPLLLKVAPSLPGVDEHQRPPFRLAEMHENMRRDRAALKTPFRHRAGRIRATAPSPEDDANAFDLGKYYRPRLMTQDEKELSMVVGYFLSFGAKGGRDGLTLQNLESAFRASRRSAAFVAIEKKGKAAFAKCLAMIEAHGLAPDVWVADLLSKNRKGDSFTTFDLGESIRAYNRTKPSWLKSHKQWLRGFMISEKDVRWCLRFVDPDGNTDVDAEELTNAVRSTLDGKPRISWEESRAVALILEFERFMSVNRIRLVDLFEKVDMDKGGTIDAEELREFLKLGQQDSVGDESTRVQRRTANALEWEREKGMSELRRKASQAKARLTRARETGAYDVLNSLKKFTKTTGLRVSELIQATGAHPDEGMTSEQLEAFFERATLSHGRFTKDDLERLVVFFDDNGDGLLSLGEVQLALGRQVHDELLLRKLAKAVALHMARKEREQEQQGGLALPPPERKRTSTGTMFGSGDDYRSDLTGNGRGIRSRTSNGGLSSWNEHGGSSEASLRATAGETEEGVSEGRLCFGAYAPGPETASFSGSLASGGAGASAHDNFMWILDDASSIDSIAAMEGLFASLATGERRAPYYLEPSLPRTAFKVQAGSNLDSSWLPGFDHRFECQRVTQGQRVVGGPCTWYTN